MLKYSVTIFLVVFFVVGAPTFVNLVTAQHEWKTYMNPEYGFTLEYPNILNIIEREVGNYTNIYFSGSDDTSLSISIIPIDINRRTLESYSFDLFNVILNANPDIKIIQNITTTEYAGFPSYSHTTAYTFPKYTQISKSIFFLKDNTIYSFDLTDKNTDFHGDEFDRMVNSIKFFN